MLCLLDGLRRRMGRRRSKGLDRMKREWMDGVSVSDV